MKHLSILTTLPLLIALGALWILFLYASVLGMIVTLMLRREEQV